MQSCELLTPLGTLHIAATDLGIVSIRFTDARQEPDVDKGNHMANTQSPKLTVLQALSPFHNNRFAPTLPVVTTAATHLTQACTELNQYFAGQRRQFSLQLAPTGTRFQQQVWQALCAIPFAHSCSYAAIANHLQNPKAVRAVGAANGRNPIAIVVPCHRVIGANGSLTGYAGGLNRKMWLLHHESQITVA
jgi:methylated-DNA-[protein]-cysteine S-methyltransferase